MGHSIPNWLRDYFQFAFNFYIFKTSNLRTILFISTYENVVHFSPSICYLGIILYQIY